MFKIESEHKKSMDLILKFHELKQKLNKIDEILNRMNINNESKQILSTVIEEIEEDFSSK